MGAVWRVRRTASATSRSRRSSPRRLDAVEQLLADAVKSDDPFVAEAARHLVEAGGKRFRPLLVLLAAQFGDPAAPGVVPAAVVVELTHLATLYHDDVMDEAPLRRGAPSANARWDNTVAILTGDFLFARASDLLADLGPEAVRIQARTFERLVTGQIRETVGPADGQDPLDHYLSVLADKTGSLIATSGRFGAMLSRRRRADGRRAGAVRRADRRRVPARRRPARRRRRLRRVRQDARHRPARGRPDPAGAPRPALAPTRPTPGCATCCRVRCPTTPSTPRRWRCCAGTRRWSLRAPRCTAGRTTPARCSPRCPTCRPGGRSSASATPWSTARPDRPPLGECAGPGQGRERPSLRLREVCPCPHSSSACAGHAPVPSPRSPSPPWRPCRFWWRPGPPAPARVWRRSSRRRPRRPARTRSRTSTRSRPRSRRTTATRCPPRWTRSTGTVALHFASPTSAYAERDGRDREQGRELPRPRATSTTSATKAIVLDIDDTTLNTYSYEIYSSFVFNRDDQPRRSSTPRSSRPCSACPSLVADAQADGYTIFFLTGRAESPRRAATAANLVNVGYPAVPSDQLFLKDQSLPWLTSCTPTCTTTAVQDADQPAHRVARVRHRRELRRPVQRPRPAASPTGPSRSRTRCTSSRDRLTR